MQGRSLSQDSKRRRRRLQGPPARLGWPAAGSDDSPNNLVALPQSSDSNDNKTVTKPPPPKRSRRVTFHHADNSASSSLWTDKYAPTQSTDLCVAPKKVKEIATWIDNALSRQQQQQQQQQSSKLLVVVGSPGIGKSTAVRCLAQEKSLSISEWNESFSSHVYSASKLLSVDQQTPLNSFREFLKQSGVGYQSLVLSQTKAGNKRKAPDHSSSGSIILLEDLPNLHNDEQYSRFRDIMSQHIHESQIPTILIFSNVTEGKHKPEDLERLIHPQLLYSPAATILQIQPATKSRMRKVLDGVAKEESLNLSSSVFEDLHVRSGGDLRFAITTLQYEQAGQTRSSNGSSNKKSSDRDTRLSTFHALGKLLYAKRKMGEMPGTANVPNWNDDRPPLGFDPEKVMEHSDIELSGALSFLGYHSIDFFSDVSDLGQALGHFSDAAVLLDGSPIGRHYDSIYPDGYIASLAGRAVANANRHPTASKFRQFSAPKVFEVIRKRRENDANIRQLHSRLSLCGELGPTSLLGATRCFVADYLPFVRRIAPNSVSGSLGKMHSHFRPMNETQKVDEEEAATRLKEQEEVLAQDDIGDFDDDDDGPSTGGKDGVAPSISPTSTVDDTKVSLL